MAKIPSHATLLMSGGIDSAACAHLFLSQGLNVEAVFVDFGQASRKLESRAVKALASNFGIPLKILELHGIAASGAGELPGRNAFLVFTALFASQGRPGVIGLGIHAGTPYFDCSTEFLTSINRLVSEQTDGKVAVAAPFISWSKSDVYDYFRSASLPVTLTYSCEAGCDPPCGTCASCLDRRAIGC